MQKWPSGKDTAMTQANFAYKFFNSITSWNLRTFPSIAVGTSLLLLGFFTGLAPSVLAQETSSESATESSRIYHTRFRLEPGEGIHEVAIEGQVRFSPDETTIEWMGDGAYVRIIILEQGQKLRYDAKSDGQGHPSVSYKVDGQARPYDGEASRYLANILPVVFRELGFDELSRVKSTYEQDGAEGVYRMISEIRSDYSVGLHLSAFLGFEGLSDDEIIGCFSLLGQQSHSDQELANLLFRTSDLYRERPGIRHAYLECLNQFRSDIERSRTTQNLFGLESISSDEQPVMTMTSGC